MTPVDETLVQIEPLYFLDYAIFTGAVRHYASRTLEEAFKADPNPLRRRLHFVNLVKEEYAAYEDAGAMLKARNLSTRMRHWVPEFTVAGSAHSSPRTGSVKVN